jgi:N-hydroxyarylamine O-acetyltransferase
MAKTPHSEAPHIEPPLSAAQVTAYLERIGIARPDQPDRPDADYLRRLQRRHLHTVPFENLSIHIGEDIPLETGALFEKIVMRRRGGYCYEVNGALAALLGSLGYRVSMLAARVYGPSGFGPLSHLVLRVDIDEPWLVDVGFGRNPELPLRLDDRSEQNDVRGMFRIETTDAGDLDVYRDGSLLYRIEQRPRELGDFKIARWCQRTSPGSPFAQSPFCTLFTDEGTITLAGRRLITTEGTTRREEELESDEQVLAAYRKHFGLSTWTACPRRRPRPRSRPPAPRPPRRPPPRLPPGSCAATGSRWPPVPPTSRIRVRSRLCRQGRRVGFGHPGDPRGRRLIHPGEH